MTTVPCAAPLTASSRAVVFVESSSATHRSVAPSQRVCRCGTIASRVSVSAMGRYVSCQSDLHAHVNRWRRMGQGTDRYDVHAGFADGADVVECDAAGRLDHCTVSDVADGLAELLDRHVVEKDGVGRTGNGVFDLRECG